MFSNIKEDLQREIEEIKDAGLYKSERIITTPQGAEIDTTNSKEVLNFCANNYLGLSSHPDVIQAGKDAIDSHGYGLSSVRFICGTQDIHKELERKTAEFLGMEDHMIQLFGYEWKETLNDDESNEIFYFNISVVTREISQWYGE